MRSIDNSYIKSLTILGIFFCFVIITPYHVGAVGTAADLMCLPWNICPCHLDPDPKHGGTCTLPSKNTHLCPNVCIDTTGGGTVLGTCPLAGVCKGVTYSGLGGGSSGVDSGLLQLGKALGPLLQQLLSGGKEGGGGDSGSGSNSTGCSSYYQTSIQTSDPCATYVPLTSTSLSSSSTDASNALMNALNGSTFTSPISDILNTATSVKTSIPTHTPATSSLLIGPVNNNIQTISATDSRGVLNINGVSGSIHVMNSGATFEASTENVQSKTETAVFYGANTLTGSGRALVTQWCHARPWSTNFLGKIIPTSFFDSLCQWQGYEVGIKVPVPTGKSSGSIRPLPVLIQVHATTTPTTTPITLVPGKVRIWAVPAAVAIGSRTNIYWSSQGVSNCTESSPDASFTEHSVTGGASTVPITAATIFTISCLQNDGTPITAYTTVNISL